MHRMIESDGHVNILYLDSITFSIQRKEALVFYWWISKLTLIVSINMGASNCSFQQALLSDYSHNQPSNQLGNT